MITQNLKPITCKFFKTVAFVAILAFTSAAIAWSAPGICLRQLSILEREVVEKNPHLIVREGTVIYPGVTIGGNNTRIGKNCELLPGVKVLDSRLDDGARLEKTSE